jgi:hypothetical protein
VLVWARDEDGHGDVGGFVIDRTKDNPAGYHASVITGKTSNRALGIRSQPLSEDDPAGAWMSRLRWGSRTRQQSCARST